jgi:hypothetical protein
VFYGTPKKQSCKQLAIVLVLEKLGWFCVVELTPKTTVGRGSSLGGANRHTIEDEDDDEDEDDCGVTRHHIKIADPLSIPHKCMRIYQPPPWL